MSGYDALCIKLPVGCNLRAQDHRSADHEENRYSEAGYGVEAVADPPGGGMEIIRAGQHLRRSAG